jgi:3-deoxy-D-manno-octulosonic-acid transferase
VLIGPSVFNFEEVTALGVAAGAVIQVPDAAALADEAAKLLADSDRARAIGNAGERFADQHRGAVEHLLRFLTDENTLPVAAAQRASH